LVYFDRSRFCNGVGASIGLLCAIFGINDPLLEVGCWSRFFSRGVWVTGRIGRFWLVVGTCIDLLCVSGTGGLLCEVGCNGVLVGLGKSCSTVSQNAKIDSIEGSLTKWGK
jgi:hypothetical protein